jgi:hypothetical protein
VTVVFVLLYSYEALMISSRTMRRIVESASPKVGVGAEEGALGGQGLAAAFGQRNSGNAGDNSDLLLQPKQQLLLNVGRPEAVRTDSWRHEHVVQLERWLERVERGIRHGERNIVR